MINDTVDGLIQQLRSGFQFDFDDSFALAQRCSKLLAGKDTEAEGRDLLIRVLDAEDRIAKATNPMWNDLLEASGLHPYVKSEALTGSAAVRHETHLSDALSHLYLHREQLAISLLLRTGRSVVVSAPTSFGKSLLIEEIVAGRIYNNVVIVQPTLALLDETRKKLEKYRDTYSLIVSTHQRPSSERNVFLFTAERVVEYEALPKVNFFVIDEFYKLSLSRDDDRAITLNQALYKLLKLTKRFYFLGPNIRTISEGFLAANHASWFRSEYATVAVDVERRYVGKSWKEKDERRTNDLYDLLLSLVEPTLIYCAAPDKAAALATGFCSWLQKHGTPLKSDSSANRDIVEWVLENIHRQWSLAETLKYGIGFHHGQLPRHLGSSLVDAFNSGAIRFLFCTSTLIEGVNTTARNVVLYDRKKGQRPIDFFDYKNIVGRSGRMKIHYVGKVFELHKEPVQEDLEVDVPLFDQTNAPLELLVQLDHDDLSDDSQGRLSQLRKEDHELQAMIKRNSGISVVGQLEFVHHLDSMLDLLYPTFHWSAIPSYQQLSGVLELCWRFFIKPKESKGGVRTHKQLATMTLQYCNSKSLHALIAQNVESEYWKKTVPEEQVRVQSVVSLVLGVARQWFEYKLPKHLAAASAIQSYVCTRRNRMPGNYGYLAALLENSFFKPSISILLDYDVPPSALRKLERLFRPDDDWSTVESRLNTIELSKLGLGQYELGKIERAIRKTSH